MTLAEFSKSLTAKAPPQGVSAYLESLWYDGKGDWEKAHNIIQDLEDKIAARIHAYLHRKEGDNGNAEYWYRRAGKKSPDFSLDEEWEQLLGELL